MPVLSQDPRDFKNVEIGGWKFRIDRMSAENGTWVLTKVLSKLMSAGALDTTFSVNQSDAVSGGDDSAALARMVKLAGSVLDLPFEEFVQIQRRALAVCFRYDETGGILPILHMAQDKLNPELERELPAVLALTVQSVGFTLSPFFQDGGLNGLLASMAGVEVPSNLPNSQL